VAGTVDVVPAVVDRIPRLVRDVPDLTATGITFRDITPLLADPEAVAEAVSGLAAPWRDAGITTDRDRLPGRVVRALLTEA
jgi:adenine/guanine phosphoribosyltransferase-like PRPP-binding protein